VGDRQRQLTRWIQAFDERCRALLDELAALAPEALAAKPRPDQWSILEIVEHLVLAERFVLAGMPPVAELVERRRSLKNRCS
jgi:nitrogen-specific signal transduction histidine kinase